MVFIRTNPFKASALQYSRSTSVKLIKPSQDSRVIVQQALNLLRLIYREGFDYAKAGVRLGELVEDAGVQEDLFQADLEQAPDNGKSERLMAVLDAINRKAKAQVYMAREAVLLPMRCDSGICRRRILLVGMSCRKFVKNNMASGGSRGLPRIEPDILARFTVTRG